MEKRMAQMEKAKEKLECQSEAIRNKIRERMGDRSKLKMRLERRERELETAEAKYQDKIRVLKEKKIELGKKNSLLLKSMERNREEVAKWRRELENTPFYELETEMDPIMTNFKILYENSMLYAKEVFFEGKRGMEMMFRQFINHYGDLEILDGAEVQVQVEQVRWKRADEESGESMCDF